MMKSGIILAALALLCCLAAPVAAQNGFTNKAEAKNELKDNLKEGKWIEYTNGDTIISM